MKSRKLGESDLNITPIGIGAWAIGGGQWEFAWGPQNDQQSIAAIHAGLDLGINWIDTAAVLWPRTLGNRRGPRRWGLTPSSLHFHIVQLDLGRCRQDFAQSASRLDPP